MVGLESIALFRNLKPGELKALRLITQERNFAPGAEIFREGTPGDGVYFVKDGLVEICGFAGSNVRRVFSQLGPGEIFGEMAVIEQLPRSASAVALKDTQVYFVPRGEMLSLIERTPALAFGLLQHISHRLREFNQLHMRELVQAESLAIIGRFAQSIVHDLKNPLSIIGLSAETYDMPNINPIMRAQIGSRIRKQINRIQILISDIIIFHEGRRSETEMRTTDYHAFILELIPELRVETEAKGAHIEMPESPPAVRVRLDARLMSRVFFNLLGNAMDFMPRGGKIFLRFHTSETELITEVEDTGPGIATEIADRLFKDLVTFGKPHGTGLGLSICKKNRGRPRRAHLGP
ncbi:MAG: cyclic nucleotide-binding domain-containing protein [Limisphaerales bacterium]